MATEWPCPNCQQTLAETTHGGRRLVLRSGDVLRGPVEMFCPGCRRWQRWRPPPRSRHKGLTPVSASCTLDVSK